MLLTNNIKCHLIVIFNSGVLGQSPRCAQSWSEWTRKAREVHTKDAWCTLPIGWHWTSGQVHGGKESHRSECTVSTTPSWQSERGLYVSWTTPLLN